MTNLQKLLERGTDKIYPSKEFLEERLSSNKPLRVYLGVDPSSPDLHIGHTVPLRKLKHFQDLGHHIILLIGSFTAMIGDPTGKSQTRKPLTKEQVLENAKNYATYAAKILDFKNNPPEIVYNGDWLEKLTFKEVVELTSHFTVQQMIERDMFQERLKNNLPIGLHEFLYPLMQGYDSVALDVDVEVGGSDQTFNMLAGRKLIESYIGKEKCVLTVPLITDAQGRKMGKSEGNAIPLVGTAEDMFGRVMSLPDHFIESLFIQCTDVDEERVEELLKAIESGENPMKYKKELASEIVSIFHGPESAQEAQLYFEKTVQKQELPTDIPEWTVKPGIIEVTDLLMDTGMVESKGEAKRLVVQGAVSYFMNDAETTITDPHTHVELKENLVLRVGKRRFVKIHVQ
jgi:tyrosyl-tRNA synthetase